jgi:hypothetical protein
MVGTAGAAIRTTLRTSTGSTVPRSRSSCVSGQRRPTARGKPGKQRSSASNSVLHSSVVRRSTNATQLRAASNPLTGSALEASTSVRSGVRVARTWAAPTVVGVLPEVEMEARAEFLT